MDEKMEPTAAANTAWKTEMRSVHRTAPNRNLSFNQPPGGADAVTASLCRAATRAASVRRKTGSGAPAGRE